MNYKLKDLGLRVTKQRSEIAYLLFGGKSKHFSADILFQLTQKRDLKISLATIYNTLKEFANLGLLKEINIDANRKWYDTCTTNHHHFYNAENNKLIDIPEDEIKLSRLPSIPKGYKINHLNLIVHLKKNNKV